jgi:hypothetical protein
MKYVQKKIYRAISQQVLLYVKLKMGKDIYIHIVSSGKYVVMCVSTIRVCLYSSVHGSNPGTHRHH